jgi:hypothetical protein
MSRMVALFFFVLLTPACGTPPAAPPELSGLWSAEPAACAAGVGVRFKADAIEVVYAEETATLFARPRYQPESIGGTFRVRITYELPRLVGGAHVAGAHGVVVLARQPDGGIAPVMHSIVDARTGASRVRIADDPALAALTLSPCGAHPWKQELRGRR